MRLPVPVRRGLALFAALVLVVSFGCTGSASPSPAPTASPSVLPTQTSPSVLPTQTSPSVLPTQTSPSIEPTQPAASPALDLLVSAVAREKADPAEAVTAASAVNAFGLDLYRTAAKGQPNKNIVMSPASVAIALSMARLGAVGMTADQMDTVLHDLAAAGEVGPIDALDQALTSRNGVFKDMEGVDHPVVLRIANAPFGQRGLAIEPAYLDALGRGFGAGLRTVDFRADPDASRALINGWVADQTEQRIKELLAEQDVTAGTCLVLVNAIYLKAAWPTPFSEDATAPAAFTLADGSRIQVPTMSTHSDPSVNWDLRYAAGKGWQAVELPYIGDQLAMTIVVPDDLSAFGASLSADHFADIVSALKSRPMTLTLPKFAFTTKTDLATALAKLGMPLAFSGQADFSGITTQEQLRISKVIHEANIAVDEAGTEATAATAVVMGDIAGPGPAEPPITVHVDRPFLFAIRDLQTGAVIFLGQVPDPSAQE